MGHNCIFYWYLHETISYKTAMIKKKVINWEKFRSSDDNESAYLWQIQCQKCSLYLGKEKDLKYLENLRCVIMKLLQIYVGRTPKSIYRSYSLAWFLFRSLQFQQSLMQCDAQQHQEEVQHLKNLNHNFQTKVRHWGWLTHICISKLAIIGSDNGLSPGRCQAIIWTNAGIMLIGLLGTNFSEILIEIHAFSLKKMHLKMSSGKWQPFCLCFIVLTYHVVMHIC